MPKKALYIVLRCLFSGNPYTHTPTLPPASLNGPTTSVVLCVSAHSLLPLHTIPIPIAQYPSYHAPPTPCHDFPIIPHPKRPLDPFFLPPRSNPPELLYH